MEVENRRRSSRIGVAWIFARLRRLRQYRDERLLCEPCELCFDARDECAPCGQPVIAPPDQCEELFEPGNFSEHAHDIEAVAEIEERSAIRALGIVHSIRDELTERGQRGADPTAPCLERMAIEDLAEAGTHRERMGGDIAERLDRRCLADPPGLPRRVLDSLSLRAHELAQ